MLKGKRTCSVLFNTPTEHRTPPPPLKSVANYHIKMGGKQFCTSFRVKKIGQICHNPTLTEGCISTSGVIPELVQSQEEWCPWGRIEC